jgi:hypothetical protein
MGRFAPWPGHYRSGEHNIDMFALGHMLSAGFETGHARRFVQNMFGKDPAFPSLYIVGTEGSAERCGSTLGIGKMPIPADVQTWGIAADLEPSKTNKREALRVVTADAPQGMWQEDIDHLGNNGKGRGQVYHGVRFSTGGHGVQWENAASTLIAMVAYRDEHGDDIGLTRRIIQVRESLQRLLKVYGSVPASILGGNWDRWHTSGRHNHDQIFPGGSDTGLSWAYFRYPHTASTAWTGLALLMQGAEGQKVVLENNPYAKPRQRVPEASTSASCHR